MNYRGARKRQYTKSEIEQDEMLLRQVWDKKVIPSAGRILTKREKEQRACAICEHSSSTTLTKEKRTYCQKNERILACAFEHCPFHEMDKYERYGDYSRATRRETENLIGMAFGDNVRKAMERLDDEEDKAYKPRFRQLSEREKWEIGVRSTQGYGVQLIAQEFGVTEEQARLESKLFALHSSI